MYQTLDSYFVDYNIECHICSKTLQAELRHEFVCCGNILPPFIMAKI
jgi:hypothetical protein